VVQCRQLLVPDVWSDPLRNSEIVTQPYHMFSSRNRKKYAD
jgi:hypothetical protein